MIANTACSKSGAILKADLLIIVSLWFISLIVVNPIGNFPLNDDWSYGRTVNHLIENGDYRPTGWTSMPLITQVLWGALFCIPDGFSFNALRLSTLILSIVGILSFYILIRYLNQPRWIAVISALTLGFNPIYFVLSNTFMTDVPCTTVMILTSIFLLRNLKDGLDFNLIIGTILAIAATLIRQVAISIPIAFTVSLILRRGITGKNLLRALIPPALCILALIVFQQWSSETGRLPGLYHAKNKEFFNMVMNPRILIPILINNIYVSLLYLGLFLMPILLFVLAKTWVAHRKKVIGLLVFSIIIISVWSGVRILFNETIIMPMSENIIIKSGIGPLTLRDITIMNLKHMPELPIIFWIVVTIVSMLGAVILIILIALITIDSVPSFFPAKMKDDKAISTFLLLSAFIYLLPLLIGGFFDRYLIPSIPFIVAGIVNYFSSYLQTKQGIFSFTAVIIIASFVFFSVCGTKDYLSWNRARWDALHYLMVKEHIMPKDIDGGFEFNGLYLCCRKYELNPDRSWWWVHGDTYQIAFRQIPGYTVVKEFNYPHWMPPHAGKIVALKRNHIK